jgi:dolichyl-phosphate beta-glucosyltransferase
LSDLFLSVVVPTFNEELRIASFITRMREALPGLVPSWEIVVADDGSHDRTRDIVTAIAADEPRVRLLALPHGGKGQAVSRGLLASRGAWRFMADADLAMPPDNLRRFLDRIREHGGPALIIGSREAPGSERIAEPWLRHAVGRGFNLLVRVVAVPGISDTQCGFKLLSAAAVETICPHLTIDGFAFDVEMLALARRAGLGIQEVGITWYGNQDSRVAIGRGAAAFVDVIRIRWRLLRGTGPAADQRSSGVAP